MVAAFLMHPCRSAIIGDMDSNTYESPKRVADDSDAMSSVRRRWWLWVVVVGIAILGGVLQIVAALAASGVILQPVGFGNRMPQNCTVAAGLSFVLAWFIGRRSLGPPKKS